MHLMVENQDTTQVTEDGRRNAKAVGACEIYKRESASVGIWHARRMYIACEDCPREAQAQGSELLSALLLPHRKRNVLVFARLSCRYCMRAHDLLHLSVHGSHRL